MAKIPIILEPGRGDGKLIKTNSVYDDNQEKFLSDKIKEIDNNHNTLKNNINTLTEVVNNNEYDIENKLEIEKTRATNAENKLRETINNITEINENSTSANIVTIDTIPNTSSSNVQQALTELFNINEVLNNAIAAEQERAEVAEQANAQVADAAVAKNEEQEQKLSELDRNISELDEQINGKEQETIITNYALTANDGLNEWKPLSLVAGEYKVYMIDNDNCLITKNPSITIQDVNKVQIASQVMDGENLRSLTLTGDANRIRLYAPASNVVNSGVVQIVIIVEDAQKGIRNDVLDIKDDVLDIRDSLQTKANKIEIGNLQDLTTDEKGSLVSAINEVATKEEPELPPYYFANDYIVNKVRTIASRCSASNKVLSFAFLTDTHIKNNAKQSAKLIKYINERLNLPFVVFGGDVCIANEVSNDAVLDSAMYFSQYISVLDKSKIFQVRGNHDFNGKGNIYKLAEGLTKQFIIGGVNYVGAKVFLSYYYVDVESMNLRIIVLDQYQGTYGGISKEERNWLLNDALNCSNKYLLFVQHQSTDSQVKGYSSAMQAIQEVLKGVKNKTNVSGTWGGLTVNHDFSNDTNILVASIVGHCHDDQSHTDNGVLTITTNCDALYEEDSHGYSRVVGTITEQCFDVFSIDFENSKIYATRIGVGTDREFIF